MQAVLDGSRYSQRQMDKQQESKLLLVKDAELPAPSAVLVPR